MSRIITPTVLSILSACAIAQDKAAPVVEKHHAPLSPAEELKTIQLPDGYSLQLVLSEPDIKEPMAMAFDGNGRLYVVEMRTYMQDIDATGEHEPKSRVSRHESTKGDGVYDKHTVFADNLLLPRMVLPLLDEVLIGVTNTNDIVAWSDKDGDGVADDKRPWYTGGGRGGNMEHQPSGLMWAMDNWIYTTYNSYRLRWAPDGKTLKEPTASNGGQWGLAQDEWGKPWYSNAGGERGFLNFQTHIAYGAVNVGNQWPSDWMTVWPAIGLFDVQGGKGRHRADGTLNHFTASCGQEIFRGDRLPVELRGNAFLPEPVGRLIRRGIVVVKDGITTLSNPHAQSEFIRSTDANFRPVDMKTGPDGCLYICDVYRGIIQEGAWTGRGSYLRPQIQRWGLDKNIGHGRVWRLVHKDFKPGPQPRMLGATAAQLVPHLSHPNGWWREMAQRLIVVRQDKSVVPALTKVARGDASEHGRAHAMWALEGLGALDAATARAMLADKHPRVRENALRAAESVLKAGDTSITADIFALLKDPDPNVVIQAVGTAKRMNLPDWPKLTGEAITASTSEGVKQIARALAPPSKTPVASPYNAAELAMLKKGETIYKELCFACHGSDGKGMAQQGGLPGAKLAPPLGGSKIVTSHRDGSAMVLLSGLTGPIAGKTYEAQMLAMNTNSDDWIASVSSYVRNSFGNRGSFLTADDVKRLRVGARAQPWTEKELIEALPASLGSTQNWKVTASLNAGTGSAAIDRKDSTRWNTNANQAPGQWFQVELPAETKVAGIAMDCGGSINDYPRGYTVQLSPDGTAWSAPVAAGKGTGAITEITFAPAPAKFIRITQTDSANGIFWSIHELSILATK